MSHMDSKPNAAKLASDMGYKVAGWIEEIFEGAEILLPDLMFGTIDYDGNERYNDQFMAGTVLAIQPVNLEHQDPYDRYDSYGDEEYDDGPVLVTTKKTTPHFVVHFVLQTDDGLQIPLSYGRGWGIFFRIPTE